MGRVRPSVVVGLAAACAHVAYVPRWPTDGRPHVMLGEPIPQADALDLRAPAGATFGDLTAALAASGARRVGLVNDRGGVVELALADGPGIDVAIEGSIATVGALADPDYRGSLLGIRDVIARKPASIVVFHIDPAVSYDAVCTAIQLVAPRQIVLQK